MNEPNFIDYKEGTDFCVKCNKCKDETLFYNKNRMKKLKTCQDCRDHNKQKADLRKIRKQKEEYQKDCILEIV